MDRGEHMRNHLTEGSDWIEQIGNTSEEQKAKAKALLISLKAFDIIEILGLEAA
jgi:1,2-phenylacetyl-CoA epoxidase catalytic subunit